MSLSLRSFRHPFPTPRDSDYDRILSERYGSIGRYATYRDHGDYRET